jgi:hypothetical protein
VRDHTDERSDETPEGVIRPTHHAAASSSIETVASAALTPTTHDEPRPWTLDPLHLFR